MGALPPAKSFARFLLCLVLALCAGCGAREDAAGTAVRRRVLVVGWDGATWDLIDPLLAQGRMPHLAALLGRGFSAELESTWIPISSAAWAAATTGQNPGRSGVYSFFEPVEKSYASRLIDARSVRATPIWRTLTRRGRASIVFSVPTTYPPEPIQGTLVSGMLAPADSSYTWPAALAGELRAKGFLPDLGMWRREAPTLAPATVRLQLDLKRDAAVELISEQGWSLAWIVFKCLDVLSHAQYLPDVDGDVAAYLVELDRVLGELIAAAGPDADVLLVSDHGFALHDRRFDPLGWLLAEGFAEPSAAPAPSEEGPAELAQAGLRQERALLARLDLTRSRLLPGPCEGRFGSLRVNLAGREPAGIVAPPERAELLGRAAERLLAARTPEGEGLVVRAVPTGELYGGPFADLLPDLVFELLPGVLARGEGAQVLSRLRPPHPDHDRVGILAGAGPHLAQRGGRGAAAIADVAPTVLALLEETLYDDLDGAPLEDLLRGTRAARFAPEADDPPDLAALASFFAGSQSAAETAEVEARLEDLGYTR